MHLRNFWLAALTSASFVVAWTRPGFCAEYYASPSGSGDGSLGSPFSLFQAANTAQAGDTVYLRGGIYSGTLRPANSGTSSAWITFAAYPGELPIFDGGGSGGTGVGSSSAQYIRFIGIVARNYSSTGFGNGWTSSSCSPLSNGNLEFINVIAEGNGINGIAFYCASGVVIERSIVAHNGNQQPSWSSGVNLFSVKGTAANNIVRQTVSFENIDISSNRTDGSGFILDQGSSGATFENNIGFRNGGSCIRLTNSGNSNLVNNTCFNNGIDPNVLYHDEIFYSDANSRVGASIRNTVAVASSGNDALWGATGVTLEDNVFIDDAAPVDFFMSTSGLLDFHLTSAAGELIDQGGGSAPATDVGFDPACLRPAGGQAVSWWQYAVDYDYIESIGGVAACFAPAARSGTPDIGAYEFAEGSDGTTSTTGSSATTTSTTSAATTATATTSSATTGTTTSTSTTATTATTGSTTATASSTSTATDTSAATDTSSATSTTDGGTSTGGGAGVGGATSGGGAAATDTSTGGATGTETATAETATAETATASATSASATSGAATGGGGTGGAGPAGIGGAASSGGGAVSDGSPASSTSATGSASALTSGGLTTTGGPGGVDSSCQLPLTECSAVCVDTASNPAHCGNCGVACSASQVCSSGLCTASCGPGFALCGQACVVLSSDALNCGACGTTCDLGQACQAGVCVGEPTGESPSVPTKPQAKVYGDAGCGCWVAGGSSGAPGNAAPLLAGLCATLALRRRRANGGLYSSGTVR